MQSAEQRRRLHELVETLPQELLEVAEKLLQRLAYAEPAKLTIRLGNLWQEANLDLSEATITQLRRELWRSLGEDGL